MVFQVCEHGYLHAPSVFISDTHLGKKQARPELLLEFLYRLRCKKIFIVGDFIEGWGRMKADHAPFDEMTLRVFDALNAMASAGVEIAYLPGNHDERLRMDWDNQAGRFKAHKPHKASLFRRSLLDQHHEFKDCKTGLSAKFYLADQMIYCDPAGRSLLVLHGDQFDPRYFARPAGRLLCKLGDGLYDRLIDVSGFVSLATRTLWGEDVSLSKILKSAVKRYVNVVENFEKALIDVVAEGDVQGIIAGHIHSAEVTEKHGGLYINSGDWVESCTVAAHDAQGVWGITDWHKMRAEFGLRECLTPADANPYEDFRGVTAKQMKWVERLWPSRDYGELEQALRAARREMIEALGTYESHEHAHVREAKARYQQARAASALCPEVVLN